MSDHQDSKKDKSIDIYGIGNALVDFEIEVTPEELTRLDIEKGVMTLVDEERQHYLLEELQGNKHKRACGGSAANTVITAAQLGARSFYSCKVANDETGDFYADDLTRNGVASNLNHHVRPQGVTGKCLVMVTPDADRTMTTFLGITGDIGEKEIDIDQLKRSRVLYLEGYLVSSETALSAAQYAKAEAKKNGVLTALSLSDPNMVKFFRDGFDTLLEDGVDFLFCNQDEALMYAGVSELSAAVGRLQSLARQFVITLGKDGALLFDGQTAHQIEPHSVKAVDTNGAGDTFAGAYLYALTQGRSPVEAARLASYASAQVVTEFGPRLTEETAAKVRQYWHELCQ